MRTSKVPVTIQRWIDKNQDLIDEYWIEQDEFGERHEGPFSIWRFLTHGWINELDGTHLIHEPCVGGFMDRVPLIKPCDCDDCTAAMLEAANKDEVRTEPELRNPMGELL